MILYSCPLLEHQADILLSLPCAGTVPSSRIVPSRAQEHLHLLEQDLSIPDNELPLYALYPESEKPDSKWRVQAVAVSPESFESRKALPEA